MQKGQILIWIIVGSLIVAIAAIAYYLGRSTSSKPSATPTVTSPASTQRGEQTPQPIPSSSPSDANPVPTDTGEAANWKIYLDSKYRFTLKYPSELEFNLINLAGENFRQVSFHEISRKPGINMSPISIKVYGLNIQNAAYLVQQRQDAEKMLTMKQGEKMQIVGTIFTRNSDLRVGGVKAVVYIGRAVPGYPAEVLSYEKRIIFVKDNNLYILSVVPALGNSEPDKFTVYFDKILPTFKFL